MSKIEAEIDKLVARRAAIWAGAPSAAGEQASIANKLQALYAERRAERAGGKGRDDILKSAKIDEQIERLMSG